MVERQPQRRELAAQFSQTSEHSPQEIAHALSAFIDPNNPRMSLDNFFNQLTRMAVGTGSGRLTGDDRHVAQALQGVLTGVRDARLFNETYLGHLLSESSIPGMLGYMLAMRIGSNTVAREVSIAESDLEPEAMRGLMEIVGYDPDVGSGTFTSGGSMANMTALAVARKLAQVRIEREGRTPGRMRVLTSPFAHYSIEKACDLLGGPSKLIELQRVASQDLRMSPEDLQQKIEEAEREGVPIMAVLAIAGETETGLVDPLDQIANVTEQHNVSLIVDGAYGAPYRLSRKGELFAGMERAMAISIDPHKALYTPYNNGAVLFRNAEDHAFLNVGIEADYLEFQHDYDSVLSNLRTGQGNLGEKRIEGSMSAGPILSTVAVLRTLGQEGLSTVYDLTLDRTNHLFDRLAQSQHLVPLHEPDLNLLCFTLTPRAMNQLNIKDNEALRRFIGITRRELDNDIKGKGGYFFSETNLPTDEGEELGVYRACILNPRTTDDIIDDAVSGLEEIIQRRIEETP